VVRADVSPKAIRDIWNRRTWAAETQHLWGEGEVAMVRTKPHKSNARSSDPVWPAEEDEDCPHRRPIFYYRHLPGGLLQLFYNKIDGFNFD
jgi:hypothetical protein